MAEQVKTTLGAKIGAGTVFMLLVVSGVYRIGYEAGKIETAENLNKQVAYWKEQSEKVNTIVVTEYINRIKEVVKWRTKNVEVISVVPSVCELSDGWVSVHDSSAEGRDADTARAADGAASGIKDTQALRTIVENYATCHETREQLFALQNWIREQHNLINTDTAVAGEQEEQ